MKVVKMKVSIDQYKVIEKYQVHWGDMDSAQHVNNLVYLRWAESSRIRYFEKLKLDIAFQPGAVGPILGWQDCKYIFPMTYPDVAIVGVRTIEILEDRLIMESAVFSERHQRIACISKQQIIPYSYGKLRKVELPEAWVAAIKDLENL